jgi:PhnB protein
MEKNRNKSVPPVPEGFETVTPYLVVPNAANLIEFIENAFGGSVSFISKMDDNKIMHATVSIGTSTIMISDTMEGMEPQTAMLYLYLEDADKVFKKAIDAKATSIREMQTEFYGDRAGAVKDEWGNTWWIATHVEDVDPEELDRRMKDVLRQQKDREVHA